MDRIMRLALTPAQKTAALRKMIVRATEGGVEAVLKSNQRAGP